MLEKISKFVFWQGGILVFLILIVSYFFIGSSLIRYTPFTGDEIAHLSASHGMLEGLDINLEHPPLLKSLNALVLQENYSEFKTGNKVQWVRSVLFLNNSQYDGQEIIYQSRLVYLIFNSILLIWLLLYSSILKLLNPKIAVLFGILYVFSPSFYSHNFLLTFDVAGSITALMSAMSVCLFVLNYTKLNIYQKLFHYSLVGFSTFLAVNTKFSNYILLLVYLMLGLALIGYNIYLKRYKSVIAFSVSAISTVIVMFGITFGLYAASYPSEEVTIAAGNKNRIENISDYENDYTRPAIRLVEGFGGSLGRSQDKFKNFVGDRFKVITYPVFINRVFWFKENPIIIALLLAVVGVFLAKLFDQFTNGEPVKYDFDKHKYGLALVGVFALFPLIYLVAAWDSSLTIGYRHFYPVLIFIYSGLSALIYVTYLNKNSVIKSVVVLSLFAAYVGFGIAGISQSLNYVNPLWTQEKWRLVTDSTLSWAESGGWTMRYMVENDLIKKTGENKEVVEWNTLMDIYGGPPRSIHVKELIGDEEDVGKSNKFFRIDLSKLRISELEVEYLLVDVYTLQKLSDRVVTKARTNLDIAEENIDYLMNNEPIYQKNDVSFIYKIN
ncbi:MAG: hypothetical protein AAGF07_03325 [Patescibacteria group bacterium]